MKDKVNLFFIIKVYKKDYKKSLKKGKLKKSKFLKSEIKRIKKLQKILREIR